MPRYRFRVRTADGLELISEVIDPALASSGAARGALGLPEWSSSDLSHGDTATLRVSGAGLEGRQVKFVVERQDGSGWVPYREVLGIVSGGVASADVDVQHPVVAAGGSTEDVDAASMRVSCSLA